MDNQIAKTERISMHLNAGKYESIARRFVTICRSLGESEQISRVNAKLEEVVLPPKRGTNFLDAEVSFHIGYGVPYPEPAHSNEGAKRYIAWTQDAYRHAIGVVEQLLLQPYVIARIKYEPDPVPNPEGCRVHATLTIYAD